MTPTLLGRWETRTALLATFGLVISLIFLVFDPSGPFIAVLIDVWFFGLLWDVVYIGLQKFRWDRDWPTCFQILTGFTEGAFIYILSRTTGLPLVHGRIPLHIFILQYGLIWLTTFLWVQGPMRLVNLHWRFHGGRFV